MNTNLSGTSINAKRTNWLKYLVRGIMGAIITVTLIPELLGWQASNFWIYLGVYFIANGILSLKQLRSVLSESRGLIPSALVSIIGGLVMVITYPFSSYRATLVALDVGRITFGAIIGIIGVLQVLGRVSVTLEPVLEQADLASGALEILLGCALIISPVSWVAISIALAWIVLVTFYMFLITHRLRSRCQ